MAKSDFDRMLNYRVKHAGWIIFRAGYWAIYLLLLGLILLYYSARGVEVSLQFFFGLALSILSIMLILFGFAEIFHHKLMRKYA